MNGAEVGGPTQQPAIQPETAARLGVVQQPGNVLLAALLSSLLTGVVLLAAGPWLVAPRAGRSMEARVDQLERRVADLEQPGARKEGVPLATGAIGQGGSVTAVAESLGPAVVGILAGNVAHPETGRGRFRVPQSSGSGLIIDRRGYVVTNNHVVDGASTIQVVLYDGRRVRASIVGSDPRTDLALLKIEADGLPVARLGNSDSIRIGDPVVAIGNPVSMTFQRTVTAGIISGLARSLRLDNGTVVEVLQTDAAISPGNSGGPLANLRGEVIGITTAKVSLPDVEGIGFAVPSNTVKWIVSRLAQEGRVVRPWLGVGIMDREEALDQGVNLERGLYVAELVKDGPSALAGIRIGDVILAVDGQRVDSYFALRRYLETRRRVGDVVEVLVQRGQQQLTFKVTLQRMPDES